MMRALHWYTYLNLALIALTVVVVGYWYFLDGDVINKPVVTTYNTKNAPLDKKSYQIGDTVYILASFCKYRNISPTMTWRMVDGQVLEMSTRSYSVPIGCYGQDKPYKLQAIVIPKGAYSGTWHLEGEFQFQVNPIKIITLPIRSADFRVE